MMQYPAHTSRLAVPPEVVLRSSSAFPPAEQPPSIAGDWSMPSFCLPTALRRGTHFMAAAAVFAVSACSDTSITPSRAIEPTSASLNQDMEFSNPRHEFHTKQWFENEARQNAKGGRGGPPGSSSTGISYHG